jgi:hypothetical protein
MPTLTLTVDITDAEFAVLQRLVSVEGKGESVESYVARVGLKGLRGSLVGRIEEARKEAITTLTAAYDAADAQTKTAALDTLGFEIDENGQIVPKDKG